MEGKPTRGQAPEPAAILPNPRVRGAAHYGEVEYWAWRRAGSLRVFYNHATIYVIANFVILLIDISTPGPAWFFNVLLGWGLFLSLHALYTYELVPWSILDWEHRTAKKLIESRRRQ